MIPAMLRVLNNWTMTLILLLGLVGCLTPAIRAADVEQPKPVKFSECPAPVQNTLQKEGKGANIEAVQKDVQEGEAWYIALVSIKGRDYSITVAEDGVLMEKKLAGDGTRQIRLANCPKAVREALEEEAGGEKIEKVDKDTIDGRVSYTAGVEIDGNYYWITVDRKGSLVEKYLDDSQDGQDQPQEVRTQAAIQRKV
jgi:hypothetical protein